VTASAPTLRMLLSLTFQPFSRPIGEERYRALKAQATR
jgi:hypothetical protein